MTKPNERLKEARLAAGYKSAAAAARAMGVPAATYSGHENGWGSKITREPYERYARFFRVNIEWLLTAKGEMRGGGRRIRVKGAIRAGAEIEESDAPDAPEFIDLPEDGALAAYQVEGDSMRPRFLPGEFILFEAEPSLPGDLIDQYAIVQTLDGRRMIKILRAGRGDNRWRLDSHNADPVEDVELLGAWRYRGVLPPSALVVPTFEIARRKRK